MKGKETSLARSSSRPRTPRSQGSALTRPRARRQTIRRPGETLRGQSSRQRILDAALRLLARHGYDGMSLQMLADEVGLHKATLFHHFADKATLARAVLNDVSQRLLRQTEALAADDPPTLEQLITVTREGVNFFADEPAIARFLVRLMVAPVDSIFSINRADRADPANRVIDLAYRWLERAAQARVIRRVGLPQALLNLLGLILFYPAAAPDLVGVLGYAPFSRAARRARKRELAAFVRGALAPQGGGQCTAT